MAYDFALRSCLAVLLVAVASCAGSPTAVRIETSSEIRWRVADAQAPQGAPPRELTYDGLVTVRVSPASDPAEHPVQRVFIAGVRRFQQGLDGRRSARVDCLVDSGALQLPAQLEYSLPPVVVSKYDDIVALGHHADGSWSCRDIMDDVEGVPRVTITFDARTKSRAYDTRLTARSTSGKALPRVQLALIPMDDDWSWMQGSLDRLFAFDSGLAAFARDFERFTDATGEVRVPMWANVSSSDWEFACVVYAVSENTVFAPTYVDLSGRDTFEVVGFDLSQVELRGRVTNASGEPISRAWIEIADVTRTSTNGQGRWTATPESRLPLSWVIRCGAVGFRTSEFPLGREFFFDHHPVEIPIVLERALR